MGGIRPPTKRQLQRVQALEERVGINPRVEQFHYDPTGALVVLLADGTLWRQDGGWRSDWHQIATPKLYQRRAYKIRH